MPSGQQADGDARRRRGDREGNLAQFQSQSRIQKRIQRVRRSPRDEHDRSSQGGVHSLQEEAAEMTIQSGRTGRAHWRSEEHTSELQSLMRISYAVFCLKKKNNTT